jgi:hypothetical protein
MWNLSVDLSKDHMHTISDTCYQMRLTNLSHHKYYADMF